MLLLIDNYDSFTYNLVHYLGELAVEVNVVRNDAITVQDAMGMTAAGILLSPGPCDPDQAGICLALTLAAAETKTPLIGVCLGPQPLGHKELPMHGVQFHPESIASEHGHALLKNFVQEMMVPA